MEFPQLSLKGPAWVRIALAALAAAAVIALLWWVVWKLFFAAHAAKEQHANDTLQTEMAKGTAEAAQATIKIVTQHDREIVRIDETTRRNDDAIKAAAGADERAPGVSTALHDALCLRRVYQSEPDCAAVPGNGGGVGAAESDNGSKPAGE